MALNVFDTELRTCDRCGFDHKKSSLRKQRGLWLGDDCFDQIDKIQHPRTRWQTPRDESTTTTIPSESTPEVFTITSAGGINLITQTHELADFRDGRHKSFFMKVVSDGGPITISANPQIISGQILLDILTLRGTSDVDTIEIVDGAGVRTFGGSGVSQGAPIILDSRTTVTFVYENVAQGWGRMQWGSDPWGDGSGGADFIPIWVEKSRFDGGL